MMKKKKNLIICSIIIMAMVVFLPFMGFTEEGSNDFVFDEVVITATKREAKIQDVPLSISAMTGSFMQETGLDDLQDFALAVPGLEMFNGSPGVTKVVMRGINSFAGTAVVGQYLNEVPITGDSDTGFDIKTYDIERVEFLKGPQGTLFGEGSMGGTVRYITRKPQLDGFEFSAQVKAGMIKDSDDIDSGIDAMINVPIVHDIIGLRVVTSFRDEAGFLNNDLTGEEDANKIESFNTRISAEFVPTEKLTITAIASLASMDVEGYFMGNTDTLSYYRYPNDYKDVEYNIYDLTINYDFGFAQFTAATGYVDQSSDFRIDYIEQVFGANYNFEMMGLIPWVIPYIEQIWADYTTEVNVLSQEIRLVSSTDGPLQWTIGGFYREKDVDQYELFQSSYIDGTQAPADWGTIFGGAIFPPGTLIGLQDMSNGYEQLAGFGEVEYEVIKGLKATVGARYFTETVSFENINYGLIVNPAAPHLDIDPQDEEVDFDKFIPKFNLAYQPSEDFMVYGTISGGFRSGSINDNAIVGQGGLTQDDISVDPETLWNYELGLKSTWLNGSLIFNAAIYYMDWTDRQVTQAYTGGLAPIIYNTNIGEAHSMGLEFDVMTHPVDGLTLLFGGNLMESEIDIDTFAYSGAGGGLTTAPKGNKLPGTAPYKFFINAVYDFQLTNKIGAFLNASASFNGDSYFSVLNEDFDKTSAYTLVDLGATFVMDRWTLSLNCSNVFNKIVGMSVDSNTPSTDRYFYMNRPRTISLTASFEF